MLLLLAVIRRAGNGLARDEQGQQHNKQVQ